MPDGVLTLDPGSRFWFEGEIGEVDCFLGASVRLRRGSAARLLSTSAILASASAVGPDTPEVERRPLPAVTLATLSRRQREEVDRKVVELSPC